MASLDVPLFPLNTVLFPGGILPLRIFEPRYLSMVKRCMQDASEFGVVLIKSGREAGGPASSYAIGTLAQVVDFDQLPDGLLGITTRGTRRFRCLRSQVQDDGLNIASIELLPVDPAIPLPDDLTRFAELLSQALPQMGDFFKHLIPQYEDAGWVSGRFAEVLPISLADKQKLLEIDDPLDRLEIIGPLIRGTAAN